MADIAKATGKKQIEEQYTKWIEGLIGLVHPHSHYSYIINNEIALWLTLRYSFITLWFDYELNECDLERDKETENQKKPLNRQFSKKNKWKPRSIHLGAYGIWIRSTEKKKNEK